MSPFELQAEPVEPTGPFWACGDCGSSNGFTPIKDETPNGIEYDCQCNACGSYNTGEATEVLRDLAHKVQDAKLEWTTELPKEPGYYWFGHSDVSARMVHLHRTHGRNSDTLVETRHEGRYTRELRLDAFGNGQWHGPLRASQ